jgi:hypothetical protein
VGHPPDSHPSCPRRLPGTPWLCSCQNRHRYLLVVHTGTHTELHSARLCGIPTAHTHGLKSARFRLRSVPRAFPSHDDLRSSIAPGVAGQPGAASREDRPGQQRHRRSVRIDDVRCVGRAVPHAVFELHSSTSPADSTSLYRGAPNTTRQASGGRDGKRLPNDMRG